jgi:hypothetical protein
MEQAGISCTHCAGAYDSDTIDWLHSQSLSRSSITVAVAQMSLKYFFNEKARTTVLCVIGVLAVAYGMIRPNHVAFIIGLVFVIGGYLRIRKKLKESIQKKD